MKLMTQLIDFRFMLAAIKSVTVSQLDAQMRWANQNFFSLSSVISTFTGSDSMQVIMSRGGAGVCGWHEQ